MEKSYLTNPNVGQDCGKVVRKEAVEGGSDFPRRKKEKRAWAGRWVKVGNGGKVGKVEEVGD
jgi:hypothetical protein